MIREAADPSPPAMAWAMRRCTPCRVDVIVTQLLARGMPLEHLVGGGEDQLEHGVVRALPDRAVELRRPTEPAVDTAVLCGKLAQPRALLGCGGLGGDGLRLEELPEDEELS